MGLYWELGEYISKKIATAEWGDGVVDELAATIAREYPGMRGYTRRNLFRMRQLYEAYRDDEKVSALLTQLPWTHHLLILGQTKLPEEREFYMLAALKGQWTFRRQELGPKKVSAALAQTHPTAIAHFKNAYNLEFLDPERARTSPGFAANGRRSDDHDGSAPGTRPTGCWPFTPDDRRQERSEWRLAVAEAELRDEEELAKEERGE